MKKDFSSSAHKILKRSETISSNSKSSSIQRSLTINPSSSINNTISISKSNTQSFKTIIPLKESKTLTESASSNYFNADFTELIKNDEYVKKMSKIFKGFTNDVALKRVLVVTHPGFIMELLNSIRIRKNIRPKFLNDSRATSLYIFRIYCSNCGSICFSKDSKCELQYDMVIYNDTKHLRIS